MVSKLVMAALRLRIVMIGLLLALLGAGIWAAKTLPIDAMPDATTIQVDIITQAAGLSAVEVERTVTFPIENGINGVPHSVQTRSVSRFGLSAVTVVFEDGTDVWRARQLVLERLRMVQETLPDAASTPELGPVSTGLGIIYRFVVRSEHHSPMQLRTILDWEIVPKLRSVPGVVEVNTMGGDLKQYQVLVDPARLNLHGLTLEHVLDALRGANTNVGGGYVERLGESFAIRGKGMLRDEKEIEEVVLRTEADGTPILVKHVAEVRVGSALRYGVVTHNGESEAVTGIVMMLLGSNSRDVVRAVKARMKEVQAELPTGITTHVIYDRGSFVDRTLSTVFTNLLEGVVVVAFVLVLFLGTVRGALVVALGIPASMAVALLAMRYFGVTGDLMSLGAIDFGFLVDGPIVVIEGVLAAVTGERMGVRERSEAYAKPIVGLAVPIAFAVGIVMLVYVPLLTLEGVEGKMFRPMALTMACALLGALIYSVLFFPALVVTFVPPPTRHVRWTEALSRAYARLLPSILRNRVVLTAAAILTLAVVSHRFAATGAEFVPRIFEGDAVIAMRRPPSISLAEAQKLDLLTERVLLEFPEVEQALGQTGRAELALDSVGNDNTDILVPLRPMAEWKSATDFDDLSVLIKDRVETRVPSTFVSVSQPIEDLTNQLISGSRADVSIKLYGLDLPKMVEISDVVGRVVRDIRGTGDLRIERILGQPIIDVVADRSRMARHGVNLRSAFTAVVASREGMPVGQIYEDQRRFDLRVLLPLREPTATALSELFVDTRSGATVPLREVAAVSETDGPSVVRRQNRERLLRIDVNLRGRDLVSWVNEAKSRVAAQVGLPTGYRVEWGGQFENFERAQQRLSLVIPLVATIILGMLLALFSNIRFALAVFALVPLASTGGMLGLLARGMPFSLPAAVGFIALGGISVLNGVVVATEVRRLLEDGEPLDNAIVLGAARSTRAVVTTAAVAAFGFLPMALSTSAGAEVQRPLATVVIVGIAVGTLLTALLLPGVLRFALAGWNPPTGTDRKRPAQRV